MAKKSTIRGNWPKWALQWGVLAAIIFFLSGLAAKLFPKMAAADPETYCPMGGLEAFFTFLSRGSLPCSMSSMQIVLGLALAAAVVLFSKLFCAYICPIGTLEDLISKGRGALGFTGIKVRQGSCADKALRVVKYGLLFWVFYMTFTASELFCKNLDPYYAVATGFKGEITLWMSIVTLALVVVGGFLVDRFWCRYICPLGAASNSFKFWLPLIVLFGIWWGLCALGLELQWWWLLAAWCLLGYLLEILYSKPKLQVLHVLRDEEKCGRTCRSCQKACPYNIDVTAEGWKVTNVDCMLCGECVAACPTKALRVGVSAPEKKCCFTKYVPALLCIVLAALAMVIGSKSELPTIDENWGIEETMNLQTLKVENLTSVHCYGSSMAFKARLERIKGVHGVKTYVRSHNVVIKYDADATTPDKIREAIFVPSNFRVASPDPKEYPTLKVQTIRTEHMPNATDLNYLGLQMRNTGKKIFGLESEYDCPLIVRVYVAPDENLDEDWYREIVNKKVLEMPIHGGGVKETPLDFEFVRLEKGESTVDTRDYLVKMFKDFSAEFNGKYPSADTLAVRKRAEVYAGKPQYIYEIVNPSYEKPIYSRSFPYLSNHLSKEEGVIGMYVKLNKDYLPAIQVRFADPMTSDRIWELMTMEKWTITYKNGEVKEEDAKMKFDAPGTVYRYEE